MIRLSAILCLLCLVAGDVLAAPPDQIDGGRLGKVHFYAPPSGRPVQGLVAVVSDRQGWDDSVEMLARHLQGGGYAIVGVDLAAYLATIGQDKGDCTSVNTDFEVLTRRVEKDLPFREFHPPVVLGVGAAGAGVAYAAIGEAFPNTFEGGVGLGFTPAFDLGRKLCLPTTAGASAQPIVYGPVTNRETPWIFTPAADFTAPGGGLAAFLAAMTQAHALDPQTGAFAAADDALQQIPELNAFETKASGLPVVEVPPRDGKPALRPLIVFYSGDGGWRDIDKQIGGYLADHGYFVLGFNSLRYFWRAKQPAEMATDLDVLIRHYAKRLKNKGVILVGYSFGADLLPFIVNRMASDMKREVKLISLLGVSQHASFEIRLEGILGAANHDGPPTLPELVKIKNIPIQCVYGSDEKDSVCTASELDKTVDRVAMTGNHHFNGDYGYIAETIIAAANAKIGK